MSRPISRAQMGRLHATGAEHGLSHDDIRARAAHLLGWGDDPATWPCGETDPIFRGERGEALASLTYRTIWRRARDSALTAAQAASPLAARPYDLRHAAVSTWLSAGVPAPQVAEWAGHSVEVLLRVYAKCIDGGVDAHLTRIQATIGEATTPNGGAPVGRKDTEDHSDPTTTGHDENSP